MNTLNSFISAQVCFYCQMSLKKHFFFSVLFSFSYECHIVTYIFKMPQLQVINHSSNVPFCCDSSASLAVMRTKMRMLPKCLSFWRMRSLLLICLADQLGCLEALTSLVWSQLSFQLFCSLLQWIQSEHKMMGK